MFVVNISQLLNENKFAYSINLHMHRENVKKKKRRKEREDENDLQAFLQVTLLRSRSSFPVRLFEKKEIFTSYNATPPLYMKMQCTL